MMGYREDLVLLERQDHKVRRVEMASLGLEVLREKLVLLGYQEVGVLPEHRVRQVLLVLLKVK